MANNHAGQHANDRQGIELRCDCGLKDVKLAEKTGQRRNASHREHENRQGQRDHRVRLAQARQIIDPLHHASAAPHAEDAGERANIHEQIDGQVDQYRADTGLRTDRQAEQRIADVTDRAVSHKALDVALVYGGEGTQDHRGDGNENNDLLPLRQKIAKRPNHDPHEQCHPRNLRGNCEEGRDRRWCTFVDVWGPHVEWHGGHLEGQAREDKYDPEDHAGARTFGPSVSKHLGHDLKAGGAGETVNQRHAVKQHSGRHSA